MLFPIFDGPQMLRESVPFDGHAMAKCCIICMFTATLNAANKATVLQPNCSGSNNNKNPMPHRNPKKKNKNKHNTKSKCNDE